MTKTEHVAARDRLISRSLLLYAVIGASGVLLDYLLFLLLFNAAGLHEQLANAISTTAGITNNFVLNTLFNFRKRDRIAVRFLRFYAVGVAGIALTFVLLQVFSGWLGIDPNLVKAGSLPVVLIFQYSINKKWSFG
ncbi:Putative flippase GtrA (transmembrane translocase of bactoprenol-linked glucose) [Saccharopolyspora shandongensis]|uniref:Putative flippase GtrA (Transmembrane translocase of bactoprenol-linked glucose) n=1 Tax=Saccharopolyspora shandongensis TaxID=418495 RepID=A0A1H2RV91_9PSEU|nr:GtrA family protein [Saccharopolyspora shandongensis]SDW23403.1 Putative flippase GtrA (transmembrane translocase of bactoprenol-linked glucose) [Saccharopolyspora shandongensis]